MLKKGTAKGIDDYDSNGFTPLYYAVISKNLKLTKALLDKGCDINKIQGKDRTSVLYHAVDNVDVEMVKLLLKYKPDLSIKYKMKNSYSEDSILGVGLYAGNIYQKKESAEVLKCLLETGCDPNAIVESEDSNLTLTVLACLTCEESKIELLVEYGGNPFATWKDSRFNTVYSIIRKDYKGTSISYERQNAVYRGLVKQFKGKRFVAEENLRLRNSPGLYGSTVTAIKKGSKVEILDADKMEVIDDIDSCWVQVKIQAGTSDSKGEKLPEGLKGWCFLGYLKEE